jgi:hypothetical protein
VYVFENGDIYAGLFEDDEFNGQGRWSSVQKDLYIGTLSVCLSICLCLLPVTSDLHNCTSTEANEET